MFLDGKVDGIGVLALKRGRKCLPRRLDGGGSCLGVFGCDGSYELEGSVIGAPVCFKNEWSTRYAWVRAAFFVGTNCGSLSDSFVGVVSMYGGWKSCACDTDVDVCVCAVFVGCDDVEARIVACGGSVWNDDFFGWHVAGGGVNDGNQSVPDAIMSSNDMSSNFAADGVSSMGVLGSNAGLVGALVFAVCAGRGKSGHVEAQASGSFELGIVHVV